MEPEDRRIDRIGREKAPFQRENEEENEKKRDRGAGKKRGGAELTRGRVEFFHSQKPFIINM